MTDEKYRILLAECASRIYEGSVDQAVQKAKDILAKCGIENDYGTEPHKD